MGNNPSEHQACGATCPVETVSKIDVDEFIAKLNRITGKKYRLPTEAEWEYAARSRGLKQKWAGTNSVETLGEYAWTRDNSNASPHPVGTRKPNDLGIYDMSGNVWQWCGDWFNDNYYEKSPKENPKGLANGLLHVVRGGSWNCPPEEARVTNRDGFVAGYKDRATGFRLVRER